MNPEYRKPINIERLKRFVFLAEQEDINLSHAAKELHIPQPYLTRQIQQLEEELGVELFVRNPRLELTSYGKVFLKQAQHLLGQVEQFQHLSQQAKQGEIGRLSIGINTSISNSLLPDILRVFRQKFPQVDLVLQELLCKESRQRLQNRTLDVDFENLYNLQDVDKHHVLTYEVISKEPLVMVLPQQHSLANNPQVQLADFANEPFILPCRETVPALHQLTRMACIEAGFHPNVVQEATWMPTVLGLVASEMGVALLPANVMNLQRTGVVYREIIGKVPMFQMAIAWRRDNHSKILFNFLNVVREISPGVY
ncbi:LysR family transcriptional regulator [Calothrix sp. NIES-2100]|uniref:LysR family transcriptional regulator n=1 Tax=Calothrix sp. NIES-2100 TaxID=1954172 RepID=UPI000B5F7A3C|nr:LysR family transcriptional regulator [Calothrix sp. NIES-2100]